MRRYFIYLILAAFVIGTQACSLKEDLPQEGEGITLVFHTGSGFDVKTDSGYTEKNGESQWNENKLASVEYFLYPEGKTNENAVLHGYLNNNVQENTPYSVPITSTVLTEDLCPNNAKYFRVYVIANHDRIVSAVAPGQIENLAHTSVPELEALTQDLDDVVTNDEEVVSNQSKFLMATDGAVQVGPIKKSQTNVAEGHIDLKRVAAKITIVVRIDDQVTFHNHTVVGEVTIDRDELWEPRMSEATIYLVNGAKDGRVSGVPLDVTIPIDTTSLYEHAPIYLDLNNGEQHSYTQYRLRTNANGDPVDKDGNVIDQNNDSEVVYDPYTYTDDFYPAKTPFYTNPLKWSYGSTEEPYLKLMIPWDRVEYDPVTGNRAVKQSKQYYYRVYCPGSTGDGTTCDAEFLRNHWYKVILNVSILGSETDGGEIIIAGTYYVADWQERESQSGQGGSGTTENDSDKEAEIKGARYLFVNKDEFELFNINELSIPYTTSDPCEIVNFSAKRYTFSGSSGKAAQTITNKADWGITLDLTSENGAHIAFNHILNNDLSGTSYDVSEYEIHFRIRQISNPDYYKDITIMQYPAIKIDMENNDGSDRNDHGHTYVNHGEKLTYVGSTNGTSSGTNTNFNMVIIETTVLPPDSDFILGDPRTTYIDNIYYAGNANNNYSANSDTWPNTTDAERVSTNNKWSANTTAIEGGTRRLSYYYPVDRSNEANNVIAPKFRVASSHGATNALTYANAFRRCASYQEAGYPAGRWRLPTVAEVTYAMKLSADGKITRLFGGTTNGGTSEYWCNSGYIMVYDGTDAASKQAPVAYPGVTSRSGNTYVRCVYDEWYWGSDKVANTSTFTWGDAAR